LEPATIALLDVAAFNPERERPLSGAAITKSPSPKIPLSSMIRSECQAYQFAGRPDFRDWYTVISARDRVIRGSSRGCNPGSGLMMK
jgi:hypothetical protein